MRAPNTFLSGEAKQRSSETADQAFFGTGLIPDFPFFLKLASPVGWLVLPVALEFLEPVSEWWPLLVQWPVCWECFLPKGLNWAVYGVQVFQGKHLF